MFAVVVTDILGRALLLILRREDAFQVIKHKMNLSAASLFRADVALIRSESSIGVGEHGAEPTLLLRSRTLFEMNRSSIYPLERS